MSGKEVDRKNFPIGEQRFRIIAVSLAVVFESLLVHIADIHIDLIRVYSLYPELVFKHFLYSSTTDWNK